MNNIEAVVRRYLSKETQYALQLVGPWGSGKTHFYKQTLQNIIKEATTLHNAKRNYHPVYVSLFGIQSVEQLQLKIFYDLLYSRSAKATRTSPRILRISSKLSKLILSGLLAYQGFKPGKEYPAEVTDLAKDLIDAKDLFICFDDLERKSSQLKVEDFTGYVNMLAEDQVKQLIICHEGGLDEEETYKKVKEKVVGITVLFAPSIRVQLEQIIHSRYLAFSQFVQFLDENMTLLEELTRKNDYNYRHIIYGLDMLQDIFSSLKSAILDSRKSYVPKLKAVLPNIAKFVLTHSIEYKASKLSFNDRDEFRYMNRVLNRLLTGNATNDSVAKDEKLTDWFLDKYYEDEREYLYYDSIFGFVTGAQDFDKDAFEDEFQTLYHLNKGKELPQYTLTRELGYWQVLDLSDREYREKTMQMIHFALEGKYNLFEFLMVYHYASRFDNLLGLDLEKLSRNLMAAMDSMADQEDTFKGGHSLGQWQNATLGADRYQEAIRTHGIALLKEHQRREQLKGQKAITYTFEQDLNNLENRFYEDESFKQAVLTQPVFSWLQEELFHHQVLQARPSALRTLRSLFRDRYSYSLSFDDEAVQVQSLRKFLSQYVETHSERSLRRWALNDLYSHIDQLYNSFHVEEPLSGS